ncbi:uncharacterized protein LOC141901490 [Tubulanus polymorphus]|uniref:uncharacterized protein LOC141901490 n=1 Tax=Tubulanus polymorphus TaxID=672921 RepID=UPI003DA20732
MNHQIRELTATNDMDVGVVGESAERMAENCKSGMQSVVHSKPSIVAGQISTNGMQTAEGFRLKEEVNLITNINSDVEIKQTPSSLSADKKPSTQILNLSPQLPVQHSVQPVILTPALLQQILTMHTGIVANQNVIQITVPQDAILQNLPQLTGNVTVEPQCISLNGASVQPSQIVFAELEALQTALNKMQKSPDDKISTENISNGTKSVEILTTTASYEVPLAVDSISAPAGKNNQNIIDVSSSSIACSITESNKSGHKNQYISTLLKTADQTGNLTDMKKDSNCEAIDEVGSIKEDQVQIINLSEFMNNVKQSNESNKCDECNKVFTSSSALKGHKTLHNRKITECPVCHKLFTRNWLLQGHLRIHTGERPFPCTFSGCTKAFADKSNLRSHMLIHTTTYKEFVCNKCNKAFAQKRYLHKHQLEVCNKKKLS